MMLTVYAVFRAKCLRTVTGWDGNGFRTNVKHIVKHRPAHAWLSVKSAELFRRAQVKKSSWSSPHLQGLTYSTQIALPATNPH